MTMSYPFDNKTDKFSSCLMFDTNFTDEYYVSKTPAKETKACDQWVYEKLENKTSALMEVSVKELISLMVVDMFHVLTRFHVVWFSVQKSLVQRYGGLDVDGRCHVGINNFWILVGQVSNCYVAFYLFYIYATGMACK